MAKDDSNARQIGKYIESNQPKVVMRVREYRLLQAHNQEHLEELTRFLENQGWKTYGPRMVMLADGNGKPVEYPWTQPMVIYDSSEKLR